MFQGNWLQNISRQLNHLAVVFESLVHSLSYQLIYDAFASHTCYSQEAKQQSVNALASGFNSLGSSPGQVYCVGYLRRKNYFDYKPSFSLYILPALFAIVRKLLTNYDLCALHTCFLTSFLCFLQTKHLSFYDSGCWFNLLI